MSLLLLWQALPRETRLRKGALSQTSYQLLGEMVDTWRRGASRREEWETGSKEKLGPRSCGAIRMLGER